MTFFGGWGKVNVDDDVVDDVEVVNDEVKVDVDNVHVEVAKVSRGLD